jgi:hypothetical protein
MMPPVSMANGKEVMRFAGGGTISSCALVLQGITAKTIGKRSRTSKNEKLFFLIKSSVYKGNIIC